MNEIIDDIHTNTLYMASIKLSIVEWHGKDALYDMGMVYKQQYRLEIQSMQEEWFRRYLMEENKWKSEVQKMKTHITILIEEK